MNRREKTKVEGNAIGQDMDRQTCTEVTKTVHLRDVLQHTLNQFNHHRLGHSIVVQILWKVNLEGYVAVCGASKQP